MTKQSMLSIYSGISIYRLVCGEDQQESAH